MPRTQPIARAIRGKVPAFLPSILFAVVLSLASIACSRPDPGSPEAVADAFTDVYFRQADQQKAEPYTAFGAQKMLKREIADVEQVRKTGYTPSKAGLAVGVRRGKRVMRGERVRFDYILSYPGVKGAAEKHVDIELAQVHGKWKVVRVTMLP